MHNSRDKYNTGVKLQKNVFNAEGIMDKNKTQPKAFRITEETADKFKEIAQALGGNQQQTLAKLIEVYEMEMGKETLPEMRENIDTFEGYVRAATNMYLQALEASQNMRALVRTEFESLLKSKDQTIGELQERVKKAEEQSRDALEAEKKLYNTLLEAEKQYTALEEQLQEEKALYKERLATEQKKYASLDEVYGKLQSSEAETKTLLASFMRECEELKKEKERLQEAVEAANDKLQEKTSENEYYIAVLQEETRQLEEQLNNSKREFEHTQATNEMQYRLELQIQENRLKEMHRTELDGLRRELDRYKELYYQQKESL